MSKNAFAQAMNASARTQNGALSYASPDVTGEATGRLSLFFKGVRGLGVDKLREYLQICAKENLLDTFLLAFHIRDCRGGKGERELGKQCLLWLCGKYPELFDAMVPLIPEYGRWDDLLDFFPVCEKAVELMAQQVKEDYANMLEGKPCSICAKWTPTEKDSQDRKTRNFSVLARKLGCSEKTLRKKYNTPLRTYLNIVERYMCSGRWNEIEFDKVPSCAMKRLKDSFEKHDGDRFRAWKEKLASGATKVNAKQLYPHELVGELRKKGATDEVVEAQWKVLMNDVKKIGAMKNMVAVIDVSGSMETPKHLPMDVSIAMGLIISEAVEGTFHGNLITFSEVPSFAVIPDCCSLYGRYLAVKSMEWGGSTDLEAVFKLILSRGKECKLKQEDMPEKLIIVSDMQFNSVGGNRITNMENINEMYEESGYKRPQIVFWNVNGSFTDFPITKDENGTCMISGFSPSILKSLLTGEEYTPYKILRETLDNRRYDKVRELFREKCEENIEDEYDIIEKE
jgi:Mg-chelatase subunit ChlD